ncbi:hypothetical protein KJ708_05925 [bacterium]|nr:hypothetical protein [bacterium]MBU1917974.1 hypothetical protein [bacterium]
MIQNKINKLNIAFFVLLLLFASLFLSCSKEAQHGVVVKNATPHFGHFSRVNSCTPLLSWEKFANEEPLGITYDVAIYNVLTGNKLLPDRGERVYYVENIRSNNIQIYPPLQPHTKYFWSVRQRYPDGKVADWSRYSKGAFINLFYGIKTPGKCE